MEAQKWLRYVTGFVTESETGQFCGVGLEALSSLDLEAARDGELNPIFSAIAAASGISRDLFHNDRSCKVHGNTRDNAGHPGRSVHGAEVPA